MSTRSCSAVGAALGVSLALTVASGSATADDEPSAASTRPSAAAAPLPATGSWAVGYGAVIVTIDGVRRLELVDQQGQTVKLIATGDSVDAQVVDVRRDGRKVVTSSVEGSGARQVTWYSVYDVATGARARFGLPGDGRAQLTDTGLVTTDRAAGSTAAVRTTVRDLAGRWKATWPVRPGAGTIVASPGGSLVMQKVAAGVALRRAADGVVVRTIPRVAGEKVCEPLGIWGQGYVKIGCDNRSVFAVSTSTGRRIKVAGSSATPDEHVVDAWPTAGRRSAQSVNFMRAFVGYEKGTEFEPYSYVEGPMQWDGIQDGVGAHGRHIWTHDSLVNWFGRTDTQTLQTTRLIGDESPRPGDVASAQVVDLMG